jgi:hypothetical protein
VLVAGWGVFLAYAYPGVMSAASVDQLDAVHALAVRHASSPLFVVLWWLVDRLLTGPFGMLVIQSGTFLAGAYLIARHAVRAHLAAAIACVVLVSAVMAMVWAQSFAAGLGLLAVGLLLVPGPRARWAAFALTVLTVGVWPLAAVAMLPVLVLLVDRRPATGRRRGLVTGLAAWLATGVLALGVTAAITQRAPALARTGDAVITHQAQAHDRLVRAGVPTGTSKFQAAAGDALVAVANSPLGTPWLYLVLGLALLALVRDSHELCAVVGSGLAVAEAQLAVGETTLRGAHWLIACVVLAAGVALARWLSRGDG